MRLLLSRAAYRSATEAERTQPTLRKLPPELRDMLLKYCMLMELRGRVGKEGRWQITPPLRKYILVVLYVFESLPSYINCRSNQNILDSAGHLETDFETSSNCSTG
jgi:hypothetical protein